MKTKLLYFLVFAAFLVSACSGGVPQGGSMDDDDNGNSENVVQFAGAIETMEGNQWVINGQVFTIDDSALDDDSDFQVGDEVEVEVKVMEDGTMVVLRVERASSLDDDNNNDDDENSNNNSNSNSNVNSNANNNSNNNSNSNSNANSNSNLNSNNNSNFNSNSNGNRNSNDNGNENDDNDNDDDDDDDD